MENIIEIIQKHSLTVRCLPHEVVTYWGYQEGDEHKNYVNSKGEPIKRQLEVVIQDYNFETYRKNLTPYSIGEAEKMFKKWKEKFPNGKKLLKETRKVEHGGWWYVKSTSHTDSTIRFSREHDKFFAPTLEEAIQLYLESLNT